MKVVVNKCYGGYSLSPEACLWLHKNGYDEEGFITPIDKYYPKKEEKSEYNKKFGRIAALEKWRKYLTKKSAKQSDSLFITVFTPDEKFVLCQRPGDRQTGRHHPLLVKCVETLGKKANGGCANLEVVEIPDGVQYQIEEYDGYEHIAEVHRTW